MTLMTRKMALAATALLLTATANAQETHALRLALEAGKTLAVTTVSETKMSFTGAFENTMNTKTTMVQNYKFDKGDEGWWKFDISTTDFKLEGDAGMPGMEADPAAMSESVKKVTVGGEVNSLGKTRNVKVGGEATDVMTKGMLAAMVEHLNQVGFMAISFPEAAVGVGTKWKHDFDMGKIVEANGAGFLTDAKGNVPMEFEILGFEDVAGKKTVKIKVFSNGNVTFESMGKSGTMSTTSNGNLWLDLATGLPVKGDSKMANHIAIPDTIDITQEMSIATTAEVKA